MKRTPRNKKETYDSFNPRKERNLRKRRLLPVKRLFEVKRQVQELIP